MSLNSNTQELNTILDTMNNLPLGGGGLRQIEQMIDESGVLDSTEGTATEKVEQVIDMAELIVKTKSISFHGDKTIERIDFYLPEEYGNLMNAFNATSNLKFMVGINVTKATNLGNVFNGSGIEVIQEPFDFSNYTNYTYFAPFAHAMSLREVRVVKECMKFKTTINSPVLSAESIQSLAYGLAYVTTAQILTLAKVFENDFVKLPAELRDLINAKGWTLAFA